MRIAVIGAGYTGRQCARRWSEAGHSVTATVAHDHELPGVAAAAHVALVARGSDRAAMDAVLQDQDAVLVSVAGGSTYRNGRLEFDLDDYIDSYVGTARTLGELIRGGTTIGHLTFTSSTNAYGNAGGAHMVSEDSQATPSTPQQQALLDAEQEFLGLARHGVGACVLRVGHIYGPGPGRTIADGVDRMPGRHVPYPEDSHVSLVHVDDVVGACIFALERRLSGIFNLVDDTTDSRAGFYGKQLRARGLGEPTWDPPGGAPQRVLNQKMKAAGFEFTHPDAAAEG